MTPSFYPNKALDLSTQLYREGTPESSAQVAIRVRSKERRGYLSYSDLCGRMKVPKLPHARRAMLISEEQTWTK